MKGLRTMTATGHPAAHPTGFDLACGEHYFSALPWAEGVMRLEWTGATRPGPTPAVVQGQDRATRFDVRELLDGWRVSLPGLSMRVQTEPLSYAWRLPGGEALLGPLMVGTQAGRLVLAGPLKGGDAFYGLGEKPGYLDRRGRAYTMWTTDNTGPHVETDDRLYQAIPFLITMHQGRFCGLLFDDPGRTTFDLGAQHPDGWHFVADGASLRLWVLAGPTLGDVLRRYAALTGKMTLPPRWALGYHQSRWSYASAAEVEAIAAQLRGRRIPADVVHLDIDYMDAYRVFTWHPTRFPDPKGLHERLRARGFRTVAIVDPGVKVDPGYEVYDEVRGGRLDVRLADGRPFVGKVWPDDCVFPDFLRPEARALWARHHAPLLGAGVAGLWCDMNEPSVFRGPAVPRAEQTMPDDASHGDPAAPVPHRRAHNLYGMHMAEAAATAFEQLAPDLRPFVITRAGFAGVQRHAMVWTGDNHSIWAHLEQGIAMSLGLGLSGVPFVGPDVGGFSGDCTAELLVRWTQAGALTPFFRNHSALGTRPQEPWAFGPQAEALVRAAIELRYRLLPYIYTCFRAASEDGLPIMRPMMLDHGDDPATHHLADQFMFGRDLLVAPVCRPGATHRMVWFPAGLWHDFHTGEPTTGPGFQVVPAPLDRLPLYVRGGALLPTGPVVQHSGEPLPELTLRVFPGADLEGAWFDDDGDTIGHVCGAYADWRWIGREQANGLEVVQAALHRGWTGTTTRVRVAFGRPVAGATWEGAEVPVDGTDVVIPLDPGTLRVRWA